MRTMLILLILICSLAQLASAGAPPKEVDSKGCGTTFTCFVPEKCKKPTVTTMAASKVVGIHEADENMILNDCDAIIRFYRYDSKRIHVSIESFQDTVKKIEFKQEKPGPRPTDPRKLLNLISCEYDKATGKTKGIFSDKLILDEVIPPGNLKCIFEHKTENSNGVFIDGEDFLTIVTYQEDPSTHDLVKTLTKSNTYQEIPVRCDPDNIEYEKPSDDKTKLYLYRKISFKNKPVTYDCDDETSRFKMEYKDIDTGSFVEAKSMKCANKLRKFEVTDATDQTIRLDDSVEIRCVAESKFFCKYLPKVKVNETPPVFEEKRDGNSLKCPDDKPHFVIVGEIDEYYPEENPKFKCMAFGETALWTINSQEFYTEDGLTVYCTNKLKCENPISANAVVDGTLGSDTFPKCFKDGTLKTTDGNVATNFTCDYSVGKFKYTAGGAEKMIDDATKFICHYPPEEVPPTFDEETKGKMEIGLYVAFGVSALVVAASCITSCLCMKRKMKKKKKEYLAEEKRNVQYMTREEKALIAQNEAKLRKLNPQQKSGEKSKPVEKDEKDEKMEEQKGPTKNSQHQSMTKLGVHLNAKDQQTDINRMGVRKDGDNIFDKRGRRKGLHDLRKNALYNGFYANKDPIAALAKEMDEKRKKGKIPADNES